MTLRVSGDSGVNPEDANSYVSTDEADTYFEDRFNLVWPTAPDPEASLIKATAYIDNRYRGRWHGTRTEEVQALAWPRMNIIDEDGYALDDDVIPQNLKFAVFEAALRVISGELYRDWDPSNPTDVVEVSSTVGPISKTVVYGGRGYTPAPGRQPIYAIIDDLLFAFVRSARTRSLSKA